MNNEKDEAQFELHPNDVRDIASNVKDCDEIITSHNKGKSPHSSKKKSTLPSASERESVISFLVKGDSVRVNVYCQRGTVGVCHVLNGQVREIFRQNCSLEKLGRILCDPPSLSVIGVDFFPSASADNEGSVADIDTITSIRNDLELADVGIAILLGEANALKDHLHTLQHSSVSEDASSSPRQSRANKEENTTDIAFSLPAHTVSFVENCLADSMDDPIHCVATNGPGTIFLYDSGEWAYTSEIPEKLQSVFSKRSRLSPIPVYVSLGSHDRFFVKFADGSCEWRGSVDFEQTVEKHIKNKREIRNIAFGSDKYSHFVVFEDGSWEFQGAGIPDGLESKLKARKDRDDLTCVTLGPDGEWFLKVRNGRNWWGNVSDELDEVYNRMCEEGFGKVEFVVFGEYNSYVISCES